MMKRWLVFLASLTGIFAATAAAPDYISIRGTTVVGRILDAGGAELKSELDVEFKAFTDTSSAEAIGYMAVGAVDLAMTPRHMTAQEQAMRPDKEFNETVVGYQSIVIIISDELWEAGVKALTREQLRSLYEGDIKNWREVGGPNRTVTYINRTTAYGVWDGDVRKAPLSKVDAIDRSEELKTAVQFNTSAFSVLECSYFKEGQGLHALGIKKADGTVIEPTLANVVNGSYEMVRPLVFTTNRKPTGKVRDLLEYLTSDKGQALVKRAGNIPATEFDAEKAKGK
jgi:phosphate transport system substrate-binding protein